jgi:deoxyribonuclease-4
VLDEFDRRIARLDPLPRVDVAHRDDPVERGSDLGVAQPALLEAIPVAQSSRVGICLDTAHVFAAGYDLRADPAAVLDEFDRRIGLERLLLFHLNDSVNELASRRDRHANIGEGRIGAAAFGALLSDERVAGVPGVLETPKGDDPLESDRRNLATLRESMRDATGH